jgi:hypothetical protein
MPLLYKVLASAGAKLERATQESAWFLANIGV